MRYLYASLSYSLGATKKGLQHAEISYLPHCGEMSQNLLHVMLPILAVMCLTCMIASGMIVVHKWQERSICEATLLLLIYCLAVFPACSSNLSDYSMYSSRPFKWKHKGLRVYGSNETKLSCYMKVYTVLDMLKYQLNGPKMCLTKAIASNKINMLCHVHVLHTVCSEGNFCQMLKCTPHWYVNEACLCVICSSVPSLLMDVGVKWALQQESYSVKCIKSEVKWDRSLITMELMFTCAVWY
jgi:hypothetical protein